MKYIIIEGNMDILSATFNTIFMSFCSCSCSCSKGINEVFKIYVEEFHNTVMKDREFDKHDFIIIFFSVFIGMKYIKDITPTIHNRHIKKLFSSFSEDSLEEIEDMILKFCDCQKNKFRQFMDENNFDCCEEGISETDVEKKYLLPYLDNLFKFLYDHMNNLPEFYNIDLDEVNKFKVNIVRNYKTFTRG